MWLEKCLFQKNNVLIPKRNQQLHNPPITIPTRGNAHIMYRIFFLFHSTFGMGIVENILNDRSSDFKKVIILVLEHCSRNRGCAVSPAPFPLRHLRERVSDGLVHRRAYVLPQQAAQCRHILPPRASRKNVRLGALHINRQ